VHLRDGTVLDKTVEWELIPLCTTRGDGFHPSPHGCAGATGAV
jgi:hypothetical protein